jgi:hypothetical protein
MTNRCIQFDVNANAHTLPTKKKKIIIIILLITVRNYPEKNVCSSRTVSVIILLKHINVLLY